MYQLAIAFCCLLLACQGPDNTNSTSSTEQTGAPVNEQSFIKLGGVEQYVEITGVSDKNPVLLFIHGGPGWPQTPYLRYFNSDLTKSVVLVAWEQSGCGKSYMNNPHPPQLSLEQMTRDAHELTQLLKKKFHQDKIFLAGFSWGSVIGMHLVQQYPEDYAAYFGISQVININRSIELSRDWIREQATAKGDQQMLQQLTQLENNDTSLCTTRLECFIKKYEMLSAYNGAVHSPVKAAEIAKADTLYEDYKKYDWFGAFMFSATQLENDMFSTDFTPVTALQVPAYFFAGRHDQSLPGAVTADFVQRLNAPVKEMVWFEQSGHEVPEEEAEAFNKAIIARVIQHAQSK